MECQTSARSFREPWNKGKLVGQKAPLKLKEIWAIRVRVQLADRTDELITATSESQGKLAFTARALQIEVNALRDARK